MYILGRSKVPWLCVLHKRKKMPNNYSDMFLIHLQIHFNLLRYNALLIIMLKIIFISNLKIMHNFLKKMLEIIWLQFASPRAGL